MLALISMSEKQNSERKKHICYSKSQVGGDENEGNARLIATVSYESHLNCDTTGQFHHQSRTGSYSMFTDFKTPLLTWLAL